MGSFADKCSNGSKGAFSADYAGGKDDTPNFKAKLDICVGSNLPIEVSI